MEQTYAFQRLLINRLKPNPPSIKEIKELWPFRFDKDNMLKHFELLMGFQLQAVLSQSLEERANVIYSYMKKEQLHQKRVKQTLLSIDETMSEEISVVVQIAGVYLLLLGYFGEQEEMMIRCFDVSTVK